MVLSAASIHLIALGLTLLSEGGGALIVATMTGRRRQRIKAITIVVLAVNLVTHTIFWYTLPLLPGEASLRLLASELAIVMIEGMAYAYCLQCRLWRSWVFSGLLNWISYTLVVLIWQQVW
jgi:hypothetical protein